MLKDRIMKAYNFASQCHVGQLRRYSGLPYFVHPKAVARMIMDLKKDEDMVIASLLHDVVEDCAVPMSQIETMFGEIVAGYVEDLTTVKQGDETKFDALCRKAMEMRDESLTIKLADRYDNVRYMDSDCKTLGQKKFVKKYYQETKDYIHFIEHNRKNKTKTQILLMNKIKCELEYIRIKYLWD